MNENDLNIEYICEKTLLNKDDELVPIILDLIQESYKAGLCQTEFDNTMNFIEENQELKKQLEYKYEKVGTLTSEILYEENTKLINQQKEFINFLEDNYKETQDIWYIKILQKYREITGVSDENKTTI